jgi:hypothetical protein
LELRKREARGFSIGGGIWNGENGDNGNGKRTKKKVDGQRKQDSEKKHKGEHKREDTKGRTQAKKITKTANVRILYWNGACLRKKMKNNFGNT